MTTELKQQAHTPGLWNIVLADKRRREHFNAYILPGKGFALATVHWSTYPDEGRANARLIAAAPELLEALKLAQGALRFLNGEISEEDFLGSRGNDGQLAVRVAISDSAQAIAKATGGN